MKNTNTKKSMQKHGKHSGNYKNQAIMNNSKNNSFNIDNSSNTKKCSKKKNSGKKIISKIIILICIIVIIFSSYNIICWFLENSNSSKMLSDIQSKTTVSTEDVVIDGETISKRSYDFSQLLIDNPNTVGWINVTNTNIDYPVVQAEDNDYYLNHSFNNSDNSAGWVFADANCDTNDFKNLIIYGHNRKDRSMFGSLKNVLDDNWQSVHSKPFLHFL